jgi:hypothetical protein
MRACYSVSSHILDGYANNMVTKYYVRFVFLHQEIPKLITLILV